MPTNCAQLIKKHEMLLEEYGKARVRIADLEAALQPFAVTSDKIPDEWFPHECHWAYSMGPDDVPTVGDLRAARAALEDK